MAKRKLARFAEMTTFSNVIQPEFSEVFQQDFHLKGNWGKVFFKNKNPLIIELGCGKGEYTVEMARKFPDKNFIGVDIKGARIWRGAKTAIDENISNVGFLRTRIEFINSFYSKNEVDEIWLTFPDPQPKKYKKRLSSSKFLNFYTLFLKSNGLIHLKTDSAGLYAYTLSLVKCNKLTLEIFTDDLYGSNLQDNILGIKTFYEKQYLQRGMKIHYLRFRLPDDITIKEPSDDE